MKFKVERHYEVVVEDWERLEKYLEDMDLSPGQIVDTCTRYADAGVNAPLFLQQQAPSLDWKERTSVYDWCIWEDLDRDVERPPLWGPITWFVKEVDVIID